jgi:hypothetical protein
LGPPTGTRLNEEASVGMDHSTNSPEKGNTQMTMKRTSVALCLAFLLATVFGGVALAKT